jgi:hypothetical protein
MYQLLDIGHMTEILGATQQDTVFKSRFCVACTTRRRESKHDRCFWQLLMENGETVYEYLRKVWDLPGNTRCGSCGGGECRQCRFSRIPTFLFLIIPDSVRVGGYRIDKHIPITATNRMQDMLRLAGVVYHGSNHLTARICMASGGVWEYNGM